MTGLIFGILWSLGEPHINGYIDDRVKQYQFVRKADVRSLESAVDEVAADVDRVERRQRNIDDRAKANSVKLDDIRRAQKATQDLLNQLLLIQRQRDRN